MTNTDEQKRTIEKIKKLLALGQSTNENEARQAISLATKMMIENNLKQSDITEKQYIEQEIDSVMNFSAYKLKILALLDQYYCVQYLAHRRMDYNTYKKKSYINLIGSPENVEIAEYLYHYLCDLFPKLWKEYKIANNAPTKFKLSFYEGLIRGLRITLSETKNAVEQEHGLVIVKDAGIEKFLRNKYPRIKTTTRRSSIHSSSTMSSGISQGKKISLSRPIPSNSHNKLISSSR